MKDINDEDVYISIYYWLTYSACLYSKSHSHPITVFNAKLDKIVICLLS